MDARRRGWFWHWNSVVTQYAPLIGLKGVGLLNSYTVWTDRRDESPHRGYAFPSQQSEADFYGEERAELITINKILVALDLIEIRKEMLTRVDDRGRRWRVPHNLYRVKDRPDGVDLRAADVLRVARLAERDAAVFRYVRRVFSDRFRPIDGDNVWQHILTELRHDSTWRELQDRTRAIEARASARTRAGHQSRTSTSAAKAQSASQPEATLTADTADRSDTARPASQTLPNAQQIDADEKLGSTSVEPINSGSDESKATDVDQANTASGPAVAVSNPGSVRFSPSSAAASNAGSPPVVGPGNTTYDQRVLTTTTTTTLAPEHEAASDPANGGPAPHEPSRTVADPGPPAGVPVGATTRHRNHDSAECLDREPDQHEPGQRRWVAAGMAADTSGKSLGVSQASGDALEGLPPVVRYRRGYPGETVEGVASSRDRAMDFGAISTTQQVDADAGIDGSVDEQRLAGTRAGFAGAGGARAGGARTSGSAGEWRLADPAAGGPMVDPGPLVISTFEAANDRRATPLERRLLAELERDADAAARAVGSTGGDWIVAAMREAVASGSAFVAPKRIREIVARWSTDHRHAPSATATGVTPVASEAARLTPAAHSAMPGGARDDAVIDVRLPGGVSGSAVWSAVLEELARVLDRDAYDRLLGGSRITRYWRGVVEVRAGSVAAADKLSSEYRGLIERHLNSRLRRPVALHFEAAPADAPMAEQAPAVLDATVADVPQPLAIADSDVETGRQVWQALLGDLARVISPADLDRLAGVVVLGQDVSGVILLGAPSPLARRLLDGRHRVDVEASLSALLGQPSPIRVLDAGGWNIAPRG